MKLLTDGKASIRRAAGVFAVLCLTIFGMSGWYYVRNITHFGRPLVLNLDLWAYWLYPGYHTPRYYLQFGQVLRNPFSSGYYSFWDGLYSTFWGDGLWGGTPQPMSWDYDLMALGYWLCVPATLILLLGLARMAVQSLTHPLSTVRSCFAFLSLVVISVSCWMVYYSGKGASVTVVKSFFGLCLVTPLSIAFGLGMQFVHRSFSRTRFFLPLHVVFYGWFGTFLVFLVMPYLK